MKILFGNLVLGFYYFCIVKFLPGISVTDVMEKVTPKKISILVAIATLVPFCVLAWHW